MGKREKECRDNPLKENNKKKSVIIINEKFKEKRKQRHTHTEKKKTGANGRTGKIIKKKITKEREVSAENNPTKRAKV